MSSEIDQICTILDKLTLDCLTLIEQEIQTKLNIENTMCNGETHLAKARYIMGQNSVSSLQLPSENSSEFKSISKVYLNETQEQVLSKDSFNLEFEKPSNNNNSNDCNEKIIDPLKWFGVLVPQDLSRAQNMFKQALQWVIRAVNIQVQLIETCNIIQSLKEKKNELGN